MDTATPVDGAAIATSLPCVRCGYELLGLPVVGACPECGGEIRRSLMGDLLMFADAGYVRMLRVGALLAEAGIILALCSIFGGIGLLIVLVATGTHGSRSLETIMPMLAGAAGLGFGFLTLAGWWLLSTPDPGRLGIDGGVTARKIVRCGVVLTVAAWMVSAAMGALMSGLVTGGIAPTARFGLVTLNVSLWIGGVGVLVQLFGASAYMRHMATRLRSKAIASSATDVRWLTIGALAAAGITVAMAYVFRGPLAVIPFIAAYGCFALTAGRYASVVDMARKEIGLAAGVIASGGAGSGDTKSQI